MGIINQEYLYGCWEITGMRFLNEMEKWEEEKVYGGTSYFTASGLVGTFSRTADLPFGYTGTFKLSGNEMSVMLKACSIPELEGTKLTRKIKELTEATLTLEMVDDATGRHYEIEFLLLTRSFA